MDNESPKGNEKNLNWRQSKFVAEFVEHGNATQAAQAAGYSHPKQQGSRLLTHVDVKAAIEAHKRQMMVRAMDKGIESIEHLWRIEVLMRTFDAGGSCQMLRAGGQGQRPIHRATADRDRFVGFFADLEPEDDLPENVLPFKSETCGD